LVITSLGPVTSQGLTLAWTSEPGARYRVESSSNLAQWAIAGDNITGLEGTTSFSDTTAPQGTKQRFYRVSRLSP
jgi:hypothetical protein